MAMSSITLVLLMMMMMVVMKRNNPCTYLLKWSELRTSSTGQPGNGNCKHVSMTFADPVEDEKGSRERERC
jgi:hypothetical protein